mmetsp:Transcript_32907/g.72586  ORF Transcript_32907/g.72586 Transcript_32907/m.72586 type:complete len:257 (-) Transcript_32907:195-965(-)
MDNSRRKSVSWSHEYEPHVSFPLAEDDDDVSCITSPSTLEAGHKAKPALSVFCSDFWDRQGERADEYLTYHVDNSLAAISKLFSPDPTQEDDTLLGSLIFCQEESCSSLTLSDEGSPHLRDNDESSVSSAHVSMVGILRQSSYTPRDNDAITFNNTFVLMDELAPKHQRRPRRIPAKKANGVGVGGAKAVYRIEVVLADKPCAQKKRRSVVRVTKFIAHAKAKQMKSALHAFNCMTSKPMVAADDARDEPSSNFRE